MYTLKSVLLVWWESHCIAIFRAEWVSRVSTLCAMFGFWKVRLFCAKGALWWRMLCSVFSLSMVRWMGGTLARIGNALLGVVRNAFVFWSSGARCMVLSLRRMCEFGWYHTGEAYSTKR